MEDDNNHHYSRNMFFIELSQSIERKKLSTNAFFVQYLYDFKDVVKHDGLVPEEMNIICELLCNVELSINNFKWILLTLVPKEPSIPSTVCEELIVWALSVYRRNSKNETKARYILFWLLYVVEEKLTDMITIDKYYKVLFFLCNNENLIQPVAGITYFLTKPDDVQKWMITFCQNSIDSFKNEIHLIKLLNFFKSPNLILKTRDKGLFDSKKNFIKELACGLRSVRKELIICPNPVISQQLIQYDKRRLDGFNNKIEFISVDNKFELSSIPDIVNSFIKESNPKNSLSLMNDVSGWFKLLLNLDKESNLQQRFVNNLKQSLDQMFLSNEVNMTVSKKTNFLQQILEFEKFAQQGLTVVNSFIFEYLLSWDGLNYARVLYGLIEYVSFTSEEELTNRFLEKLFAIFISGDELINRMIINSLTNLLCNLHMNSRQPNMNNHSVLFGEQLRVESKYKIIRCLTKHISHWCSTSIYYYPQEEQLKHVVYSFFEKVSVLENLSPPCIWPLFTIMPPNVFYDGLFSINIYWINRLAKLMIRHIQNDTTRTENTRDVYISKSLNMLDMYMADFYNALKTGELFTNRKEGFLFKDFKQEELQKDLNNVNLNKCFQMEKHIALAPYFMNAENTVEDPMDILLEEAPYVHQLIVMLDENLNNYST